MNAAVRLVDVLLAQLRASQPEECCFMCLTSSDERDICATHRERLRAILNYGKPPEQPNPTLQEER